MALHERGGDREAQTGATTLVFSCEERIAEVSQVLRRDSHALIFDSEKRERLRRMGAGGDCDGMRRVRQSFKGINDEIDNNLLHMLAVAL